MGPPVGVTLVSILTGFYGSMWILAAMLASGQANAWAAFGPFVGLAVIGLAVGLWLLRPIAWALAVVFYAWGTIWTIAEVLSGASDRIPAVFVGFVVVIYLLARRDRFGVESPRII